MTKAITFTPEAISLMYGALRQRYRARKTETVVSKAAFARFLDTALSLSTKFIEGRPVKANFLIVRADLDFRSLTDTLSERGHVFTPLGSSSHGLRFEDLKPLLPCIGDSETYLTYKPAGSDGFELVGALFLPSAPKTIFEGIRWGQEEKFYLRRALETALFVVVSNQYLSVSIGNVEVFRIENGIVEFPKSFDSEARAILYTCNAFRAELAECLTQVNAFLKDNGFRSHLPASFFDKIALYHITELIRRIQSRRHGATVVIAPGISMSDESRYQPNYIALTLPFGNSIIQYAATAKADMFRLNGLEPPETAKSIEEYMRGRLRSMITGIAALSQTDGAVVFDEHLCAIGAGVFLKASASAISLGGARRRSAESFVSANAGSVALVISQDGDVALFQHGVTHSIPNHVNHV